MSPYCEREKPFAPKGAIDEGTGHFHALPVLRLPGYHCGIEWSIGKQGSYGEPGISQEGSGNSSQCSTIVMLLLLFQERLSMAQSRIRHSGFRSDR